MSDDTNEVIALATVSWNPISVLVSLDPLSGSSRLPRRITRPPLRQRETKVTDWFDNVLLISVLFFCNWSMSFSVKGKIELMFILVVQ